MQWNVIGNCFVRCLGLQQKMPLCLLEIQTPLCFKRGDRPLHDITLRVGQK